MKKQISIKSRRKKESIEKCLEIVKRSAIIRDDGQSAFSFDLLFAFSEVILQDSVMFSEDLPECVKREILFRALKSWAGENQNTNKSLWFSKFLSSTSLEKIQIEKKRQDFSVLLFLNIDPEFFQENLSFLNNQLTFISWEDLKKYKNEGLWYEIFFHDRNNQIITSVPEKKIYVPDMINFTPAIFSCTSFNPEAATEIAAYQFDIFRALMNFSEKFGSFSIFRSRLDAISLFLPSPVYVVYDNKKERVGLFFSTESYKYSKKKITKETFSYIQNYLQNISKTTNKNSSWGYITNLFFLYQKALDTKIPESTFLSLWQVLENATSFGEEILKNKEIGSRIAGLISLHPIVKELLDVIIERRNELVHLGKFPDSSDRLIFGLKIIVDYVLVRLLELADTYSTVYEMREYLTAASLSNEDLCRKKTVIETILEKRNTKKQSN